MLRALLILAAAAVVACGGRCDSTPLEHARMESVGEVRAGQPLTFQVTDLTQACNAELTCASGINEASHTLVLMVMQTACNSEQQCSGGAQVTCKVAPVPQGQYSLSLNGAPPRQPVYVSP